MTFIELEERLAQMSAIRTQLAGVLLKKQEKVSQKGSKYAFLQLSDPSGVYEVMIFSETLAMSRDLLIPGEMLLLNIDAEVKEDQTRMLSHGIQLLESALEGKIQEIKITMNKPDGLKKIKEFLDIEGAGRARVSLYMHLDTGQQVHLRMPGRWSLSAQARNIIAAEPGVINIAEA